MGNQSKMINVAKDGVLHRERPTPGAFGYHGEPGDGMRRSIFRTRKRNMRTRSIYGVG
jgi:hypothetical protein